MDRELGAIVSAEFPAIPLAGPPVGVLEPCPPDARAVGLPLPGGLLYVVLAPVRGDGPADGPVKRDDGAVGYFVYTPKGNGLLVLSVPVVVGSPPPAADQVQRLAEAIAQRY